MQDRASVRGAGDDEFDALRQVGADGGGGGRGGADGLGDELAVPGEADVDVPAADRPGEVGGAPRAVGVVHEPVVVDGGVAVALLRRAVGRLRQQAEPRGGAGTQPRVAEVVVQRQHVASGDEVGLGPAVGQVGAVHALGAAPDADDRLDAEAAEADLVTAGRGDGAAGDHRPAAGDERVDAFPDRRVGQRRLGQDQHVVPCGAGGVVQQAGQCFLGDDVEGDVRAEEREVEAAVLALRRAGPAALAAPVGGLDQGDGGARGEARVQAGVVAVESGVPASRGRGVVVQPLRLAHEVGGGVGAAGDGLGLVEGEVLGLFRGEPVGHVGEGGGVDEHGFVRVDAVPAADGLARPVYPQREFAAERVVRLVEQDVGVAAEDERRLGAQGADAVVDAGRELVDDVGGERLPEGVVGRFRAGGQGAARVPVEAFLAGGAVAHAVPDAAVVHLVEVEPVDEESVQRVTVEQFLDDAERAVLVVVAAGADADQAVVLLPVAVGGDEAPVGVAFGDVRLDLRQVEAADQPDAPLVGGGHRVAQQVVAGAVGERGGAALVRPVGGVEGQDSAGVEEPDVGAVLLDAVQCGGDVESRVDFGEIRLIHAERLVPPGRGGRGHRLPHSWLSPPGCRCAGRQGRAASVGT